MKRYKSVAEKMSNSKLFHLRDLIAYLSVAFFITCLIVSFIILPSSNPSNGFCVKKDGQPVIYFTQNKVQIQSGFDGLVEEEKCDDGIKVTIYSNLSRTGYNVILFNTAKKTAKVIESTCSHSKDCCYSPAISNSGIIYCAPHGLSIEPIGAGSFSPPVTGGVK